MIMIFANSHQLSWQLKFYLRRESSFIGIKVLGALVGDKVALGWAIGSLDTAKPTWDEFLGEEIRHLGVPWFTVVMDIHLTGKVKTCMAIEVDVAFHTQETDP